MVAICRLVSKEAQSSRVRHFQSVILTSLYEEINRFNAKTNDKRGEDIVTLKYSLALPMERVGENYRNVTEVYLQTVNEEGVRTVIDVFLMEMAKGLSEIPPHSPLLPLFISCLT